MTTPTTEQNDPQDPQLIEEGHAYAQTAMADPEMKAYYEQEALKQGKSAYSLALSSYFKVHRKLGE